MICPKCGQDVEPAPVGWTLWGGRMGPRMLSHVECPRCHGRFNGKTGQSNDGAVRLYIAVTALVTILACYLIWTMRT